MMIKAGPDLSEDKVFSGHLSLSRFMCIHRKLRAQSERNHCRKHETNIGAHFCFGTHVRLYLRVTHVSKKCINTMQDRCWFFLFYRVQITHKRLFYKTCIGSKGWIYNIQFINCIYQSKFRKKNIDYKFAFILILSSLVLILRHLRIKKGIHVDINQ